MPEELMDPRDVQYDFPYTLEEAKKSALWEVENSNPTSIQHLLDLMRHHCWTNDDLNRRAVLYLLDEERITIDRTHKRVRIKEAMSEALCSCGHPESEHMVEAFGCFSEVDPGTFCTCERAFIATAELRAEPGEAREGEAGWEDERDRLEAEVNRWHAESVHEQMKSTRLIMKVEIYRKALQQILWMADATEPLSVKAADIARRALED